MRKRFTGSFHGARTTRESLVSEKHSTRLGFARSDPTRPLTPHVIRRHGPAILTPVGVFIAPTRWRLAEMRGEGAGEMRCVLEAARERDVGDGARAARHQEACGEIQTLE